MYTDLLSILEEATVLSGILSFLVMIAIAFIPGMPIPLFTGAIAAAFDFWPALCVSLGGATIGALLMFLLARFLFRKKTWRLIKDRERITNLFAFLESHGFLAILVARLVPIFPSMLINLAASVSAISTKTFLFATFLGKTPTMITFTLAGNQLGDRTWATLVLVCLYMLIICLVGIKVRKAIERKQG